jgi:ATP-dependent Clp protease ATP-binding subunit ClpC
MQKQEILDLLDRECKQAFEGAKRLAWTSGGIVTPAHVLSALLDTQACAQPRSDEFEAALNSLLAAARSRILAEQPISLSGVTVPRETQELIERAGVLARSEGRRATPVDLLNSVLASDAVKNEFNGEVQEFHRALRESQVGASRLQSLGGALSEFCDEVTGCSRGVSPICFVGRGREVTAILETLCRKLKSNPLLIGRPGVGKTAIVRAVARTLAEGDVPARLRGKRILEVSRLRLLADARLAGEIEERLKHLLAEASRAGDVILFFDEMHTLLGAGGPSGTGDVANLLKSALSRGEIVCIGATTLSEYYKYIAPDEAFARRFSTITIEEPSLMETRAILLGARAAFESYHGLIIDDDAIELILEFAARYLASRCFPDKGLDLLDKAAAKASLAQSGRLTHRQIAESLSELTGLPFDTMDEDPAVRFDKLEGFLNASVPGQPDASREIARLVKIAKLRLELRPERPDGVFLFVGAEEDAKPEMASALAEFLYGSRGKMFEFDMSQFTQEWSMSRLIGAEPGYVGYADRAGVLSKIVEENPHSVLFFQSMDLAHRAVQEFLAQAFERGVFSDATGARIYLSNTSVVISLSQSDEGGKHSDIGFSPHPADGRAGRPETMRLVDPLRAAIDEVIEFKPPDREATKEIIALRLSSLRARIESERCVSLEMDPELPAYLAGRLSVEPKGLAGLDRLLQEVIVIPLTRVALHPHHRDVDERAAGSEPDEIHLGPSSPDTAGTRDQRGTFTPARTLVSVRIDAGAVKVMTRGE